MFLKQSQDQEKIRIANVTWSQLGYILQIFFQMSSETPLII